MTIIQKLNLNQHSSLNSHWLSWISSTIPPGNPDIVFHRTPPRSFNHLLRSSFLLHFGILLQNFVKLPRVTSGLSRIYPGIPAWITPMNSRKFIVGSSSKSLSLFFPGYLSVQLQEFLPRLLRIFSRISRTSVFFSENFPGFILQFFSGFSSQIAPRVFLGIPTEVFLPGVYHNRVFFPESLLDFFLRFLLEGFAECLTEFLTNFLPGCPPVICP